MFVSIRTRIARESLLSSTVFDNKNRLFHVSRAFVIASRANGWLRCWLLTQAEEEKQEVYKVIQNGCFWNLALLQGRSKETARLHGPRERNYQQDFSGLNRPLFIPQNAVSGFLTP
jgi:hypothetical protein